MDSDNISKIAQKYEQPSDPNEKKKVNDLIGFWSKNKPVKFKRSTCLVRTPVDELITIFQADNRAKVRRNYEYAHRVVDIYAGEKTVGKMAKKFDSDNKGYLDESNWIIKAKQVQQRNLANPSLDISVSEEVQLGCEIGSECDTLTEDQYCPSELCEKNSLTNAVVHDEQEVGEIDSEIQARESGDDQFQQHDSRDDEESDDEVQDSTVAPSTSDHDTTLSETHSVHDLRQLWEAISHE